MKIKLRQNSKKPDINSAQYTLTYDPIDTRTNYKILSNLIKEDDIIVELNSSRFYIPDKQKETKFKELFKFIKSFDLEFIYQKIPDSISALGGLINNSTIAHQVILYLPNEIWKSPEFNKIIPISGARYYILERGNNITGKNNKHVLQEMQQLMDDELLNYFKLIVFDPGSDKIKQMGLNSVKLTKTEIESMVMNITW